MVSIRNVSSVKLITSLLGSEVKAEEFMAKKVLSRCEVFGNLGPSHFACLELCLHPLAVVALLLRDLEPAGGRRIKVVAVTATVGHVVHLSTGVVGPLRKAVSTCRQEHMWRMTHEATIASIPVEANGITSVGLDKVGDGVGTFTAGDIGVGGTLDWVCGLNNTDDAAVATTTGDGTREIDTVNLNAVDISMGPDGRDKRKSSNKGEGLHRG